MKVVCERAMVNAMIYWTDGQWRRRSTRGISAYALDILEFGWIRFLDGLSLRKHVLDTLLLLR